MSKKKKDFSVVVKTMEEVRKENLEIANNVSEDQKSDYIFNDESLYKLGVGHSFLHGFFNEYITKTGVKAFEYYSGGWYISGEDYDLIDGEFVLTPIPPPSEPIDWSEFSFPASRSVDSKTLSDSIIPVKPTKKS